MRRVNINTDLRPGRHHVFEADLIGALAKNKAILDVGCWTGQFLSLIQDYAKCTGLEPDVEAVKFANKNRRGEFVVGSALNLPFKNSSFDVVTMWDVLEHLPVNSEGRAMGEAARVLKNGGWFGFSTVTTHPMAILLDPAFFLIGHRHYSESYLKKLLFKHGLNISKIAYTGDFGTLIRDNINLISKYTLGKAVIAESEVHEGGFVQIHILAQK